MRPRIILAFLLLLAASPASAHPLTDIRFDRTAAVRLSPDGVGVTYTLELGALALNLDSAKRLSADDISKLDKTIAGLAKVYARKVAAELVEKFRVSLDGERLALEVVSIDVTFTDHAVCVFKMKAAWPPGGRERNLTVDDGTFADQPGIINLTVARQGGPESRLEVDEDDPPFKLRTTHSSKLTPEEIAASRKASAVVTFPLAIAPPPHEYRAPESPPTQPPAPAPIPEPVVNADVPPAPNLFADLARRGLPALFDSTLGIGILLLAAFLFGMAHAFTPGHGKTLVAAYLVGERGTVRHAIILAVATTVAHTGSVIAVAAVLWGVYGSNVPGATQAVLQFVAGLLVVGVGLWLLMRRATGQADHFHLFGGHHHHDHGDGHTHSHGPLPEGAKTTAGWARLVLMGVGGGLVPCWDAVLLLVAASALGRLEFAIPLLLAFSAGLGVVLVLLGVGVVYAHRAGATRFKEHRWFRLLPVVSAVFLVGVGFWLCKQAIALAVP